MAIVPAFAFAADLTGISDLVGQLGGIIAQVIPIMFGLALVYFFWGLITYIRSAGDPKKAAEGKTIMIYGVLALAIMVAIWGLINWLISAFGITNVQTVNLPRVQGL